MFPRLFLSVFFITGSLHLAMAQDGLNDSTSGVTVPEAQTQSTLEDTGAAEAYQKGLKHYQDKDFSRAREHFKMAWSSEPQNPLVLYNWGLSEYQLENNGMALAAWRKALFLDPDLEPASRAIEFLMSTSSVGSTSYRGGYWESYRAKILSRVSINQIFLLTLVLLVSCGWLVIRYLGQRKMAVEEELPLPPIPWLGIALLVFFLAFQMTAALKVYDYFTPRATVIAQTVTVKSAPTKDSSTLFEIYEGSEVLLKRKTSDWSQVKYPGGLTGWVESQSLFHTSGREL